MKQIKLVIILSIILVLSSCKNDIPKLDNAEFPFIIERIHQIDNTEYSYYYKNTQSLTTVFARYECVILKSNLYNVGDAIIFEKH